MSTLKPTPFIVHTATYEGPLDHLLVLAQQGQVDLQSVSLADIAADYLEHSRRAFDLDQVTEALWTLSALVELKARALLPQPVPEPPPATEEPESDLDALLEERMLAYRAFKDASAALRVLEAYQQRVFLRPPEEPPDLALLSGVSLQDLFQAFAGILARGLDRPAEIPTEGITVGERMQALESLLRERGELEFHGLFPADATRLEIVVTFLALLELIRRRRVRVSRAGDSIRVHLYTLDRAEAMPAGPTG